MFNYCFKSVSSRGSLHGGGGGWRGSYRGAAAEGQLQRGGCRGAERAKRGAERAKRGAERAKRGAERAKRGAERARRGAERARIGAERARIGAERARSALNYEKILENLIDN